MTTKQKIVLWAVIIIVLMGVFPPWRAFAPEDWERANSSWFAGYTLLLWPPGPGHDGLFCQGSYLARSASRMGSVRIDGMALFVQWAIVAVAAWGLAYAFGGKGTGKTDT